MLVDDLKTLLATNFYFYIKIHGFHWNVEGSDFAQLHEFFLDLYEDVYEANDTIAEYIRALDEYAPGSFERYSEMTKIKGQILIPKAHLMLAELQDNNNTLLELLNQCFSSATQENQQGIANFIAERISQHGKHGWQLRSFLKVNRS